MQIDVRGHAVRADRASLTDDSEEDPSEQLESCELCGREEPLGELILVTNTACV
jgi:hypothetical protein